MGSIDSPMGKKPTLLPLEMQTNTDTVENKLSKSDSLVFPYDSVKTLKFYENALDVSCKTYIFLERWGTYWDIPMTIVLSIAKMETGYKGPSHLEYNPQQTSYADAIGIMQLMLSTAHMMWNGDKSYITKERLLSDVELNVYLGTKLLRYLYNIHHDWKIVCGIYNTGKPIVNGYAIEAVRNL